MSYCSSYTLKLALIPSFFFPIKYSGISFHFLLSCCHNSSDSGSSGQGESLCTLTRFRCSGRCWNSFLNNHFIHSYSVLFVWFNFFFFINVCSKVTPDVQNLNTYLLKINTLEQQSCSTKTFRSLLQLCCDEEKEFCGIKKY